MTKPCQNCHNVPGTWPEISDNRSYDCSARDYWTPSLRTAQPEQALIENWVRKNFETTQELLPPPGAPFYIDIQKADLRVDLKPRAFQIKTPWYAPAAGLRVDPEGNIHSELKIRNNHLPLMMQSLLEFTGIHFETGLGYRFCPDRVSVGDYGLLHLIGEVPSWFYENVTLDQSSKWYLPFDFLLLTKIQDKHPLLFYFPSPQGFQRTFPLGRDDPASTNQCPDNGQTLQNLAECCEGPVPSLEAGGLYACMTDDHPLAQCKPFEYPDAQENPKLDFGITHDVPAILRTRSGRIPNSYEINDLINHVLELLRQPKKPDSGALDKFLDLLTLADSGNRPEKLLDLLKTANITFELSELRDFYLPGIIDLGISRGTFRLRKTPDDQILLSSEDITINFDPMDYSGVQLHQAVLESGEAFTDAKGKVWQPGIHASYDPESKSITAQVKFDLLAELTVPLLGQIQLNTPILFETELHRDWQWRLTPGKTQFELPKIRIQNENARSPLDTDLKLVISDQKAFDGSHYQEVSSEIPHINFYLGGSLGDRQARSFEWDSYIPVTQIGKRYESLNFKHDLEINGSLKLKDPDGTQATAYLGIDTFKPRPMASQGHENDYSIRFRVDLLKGERTWQEEDAAILYYAKLGEEDPAWLLSDGRLQFTSVKQEDGHTEKSIDLEAETLQAGPLFLKNIDGKAVLDQFNTDDAITRIAVPKFSFSANPEGSPEGILRGPISIELAECEDGRKSKCHLPENSFTLEEEKSLHLEWNQNERRLRFENLNLMLQAMGITLPKDLSKLQRLQRRETLANGDKPKRRADALGLDGRVNGHFDFSFEDWSGQGDLRILGDRDGDVYFHSNTGNRIQPPLIRLTNWRFKRFDRILFDKGYALGAFRLFTRINTQSLRKFGYNINYETDVIMGHRDVMFKPGGIKAANHRYYQKLFREFLARGGLAFLEEAVE